MRLLLNIVIVLLIAGGAYGIYKTLSTPDDLFALTGDFAACPPRPSCVSSMAGDAVHTIAPLNSGLGRDETMRRLRDQIQAMGGSIEHELQGYLHAVFQTPKMHFHDDVELLYRPDGRIEVRSISRLGYRDFSVNRNRIEMLRRRFDDTPAS